MTFKSILEELQWKYGVRIKFAEKDLPQQKISLWIDNQTLNELLETSISNFNMDLTYKMENPNSATLLKKSELIVSLKEPTTSQFQPTRKNFLLSGKIIEQNSGETLPFATVFVTDRPEISTQSNVDGYFSLQNVPSDTVLLKVSYVGYLSKTVRLKPSSSLTNFTIELKAEPNELEALVVEAEKTEMVQANQVVGMVKMTPRNIAKLPNVGEKDPFRAFQLMPGVSASNESSSGLYVRGGTPDQTLVLYDGFTVYNVDHLFGFFSAFNYNAIKDIQLYKGGFDARFGGRISAVAEITGKEGNNKKFNAGVDLSLLSTNAYVESPLGKNVTLLVAARRSYKGPLYNKIFNKFTDSETTTNQQQPQGPGGFGGRGGFNNFNTTQKAASYFYDLNSKITFKPNKKDIYSLSFFNGTDNMDNSSTSSFSGFGPFQNSGDGLGNATNDISQWGNTGTSFKWSRRYNNKLYSNTLVSFSNYYSERDNTRSISITRNDSSFTSRFGRYETNKLQDFSFKTDWEYKFFPNHQLEFGSMITYNQIKFNYTQNDTTTILNRDDAGTLAAFYLQDRFRLMNEKLELIPGFRFNYFDLTKKVYTEPRLTFNYQYNPEIKIKGGAGIYNQFIKQINREDITNGNRNFWILANGSTLPVTQSRHLIMGAAYERKNYLFDIEFYQKKNIGITEYTLRFVPSFSAGNPGGGPGGPGVPGGGGGLSTEETFFNGDETIRGVDILAQKKFGSVTGWLGYTLAQAVRNVSAFSDKPYYADQDVRHQFKAVATYSVKHWDLSGTWIYSTGRPYTSIIGAYDITLLDGTTKSFTNPTDKNANRLPAYHRMDVSVNYNFKNGTLGFSVFNLYNRTNIWYKRFEVVREDGVSLLQTTDVTYLGITPNLTLSLKLR
ncbi:MAG: TonB-dependent receptor [Bacteroidetes bacterium]|nr:TonB-dependent receptor [Bacteroidota bacterium]